MKTFKAQAAQGDMLIIKVASIPSRLAIPSGLERIAPTSDNHIIVAHSETGHNHVMDADVVVAYKNPNTRNIDLYEMFLIVKEPTEIQHLRTYDTHESISVDVGTYQIRCEREYEPAGYRGAAD